MATADEQIRVSDRVKQALDRRRREGESYNDVLERLLSEAGEANSYDGFGVLSDEQADRIRTEREPTRDERKQRVRGLSDDQ
jgi:predicted CopG family antitoxin